MLTLYRRLGGLWRVGCADVCGTLCTARHQTAVWLMELLRGVQQGRHWTRDVTSKRNTLYILWVCVRSLRYPACKAHAPFCHLWPVRVYRIVSYYFINGMIFGEKKLFDIKWGFPIFSTKTFILNIPHSKNNWATVAYPEILLGGGGFKKFSWGQRTERTGIWRR